MNARTVALSAMVTALMGVALAAAALDPPPLGGGGGSGGESAASCASGSFAQNETAGGAFQCGRGGTTTNITNQTTITNVTSQEAAASCADDRLAQNETAPGAFQCASLSATAPLAQSQSGGTVTWSCASCLTSAVLSLAQGAQAAVSGAVKFANSTSVGFFVKDATHVYAKLLSQACPSSPQQFVETVADAVACGLVPWASLTSFPSNCATSGGIQEYAYGVGASLACSLVTASSMAWSGLTGFPSACGTSSSAQEFVEGVGASLTCAVATAVQVGSTVLNGLVTLQGTSPVTVTNSGNTVTVACATCSTASATYVHSDEGLSTSTPTKVQNTFATFSTGTSGSKAFGSNLGAKDTLVVCEGQSAVTTALGAPTDTLSTSFTSIASETTADSTSCWKGMSGVGGADTVTSGTYGSTCSAANLCGLYLWEFSGTDQVAATGNANNGATSTSFNCGTGTNGGTAVAFTGTPYFVTVYTKTTSGTDTAGASFTLANGETGSLLYLTQFTTSLTTTTSSFPATVGTTSVWGCVTFGVKPATTAVSVALSANTVYSFQFDMAINAPSGNQPALWLHQMDSGTTLYVAMASSPAGAETPQTSTDANLLTTVPGSAQMIIVAGTVSVGSTATTLLIEFTTNNALSTNTFVVKQGSFVTVGPAS